MNWSRVMLVGVALILPGCEMIDPASFFARSRDEERARIVQASYRPAALAASRTELRHGSPASVPVTAWAGEATGPEVERAIRELDALLSPADPLPPIRGSVAAAPRENNRSRGALISDRYDPRNDPNRASLLPVIPHTRIIDIDDVLSGLRGSGA